MTRSTRSTWPKRRSTLPKRRPLAYHVPMPEFVEGTVRMVPIADGRQRLVIFRPDRSIMLSITTPTD